jgi:acyl transferase domain-containing protein
VAQYRYDTTDTEKPFIVTFSAHDSVTLRRNIENYESIANSYHLPDLAYTLNCRRSRFAERAYTITTPGSDRLDFSFGQFTVGAKLETPVKIGFVFTGQGAQWARMGYEAMQCYPEFAKTIDSLDCVLQQAHPQMDWTLRQALEAPAEISRIAEAEISQPVCTAIQIAIVDLFASWGIEPLLTVGHSSGEIAAAYASGRTSAPQAILAAFFRGYAVKQSAPQGTMLAVALSAAEIMDLFPTAIPQKVAIACENSNKSVTLSGSSEDILSMKSELDESKIFARELRTGKAYHSPHMDTVAPLYNRLYSDAEECLTEVDLAWRRPTVAMVSSVTGSTISTRELPISYWCDNLRNRVKFNQAIHTVVSQHDHIDSLVEIGPHAVLGGSIKQICAALNVENLSYTPSLIRGSDSRIALLKTAGELFLKGADVNFEIINAPKSLVPSTLAMTQLKTQRSARFIPDLPPYDWNHDQTQWYEPRAVKETRGAKYERHDILGRRISGLSSSSSTWKNVLRQRDVPWFQASTIRLKACEIYPTQSRC